MIHFTTIKPTPVQSLTAVVAEELVLTLHSGSAPWTLWKPSTPPIIFSKYASTGDGILTSLKMMEVMLAKKKPMSELAAPLKIYPQVLENVRVTDKKAAQNDEAVQAAVKKVAEALGDTGRILVRESGTEPVVRVMVEAPDHDTCQKYVDEVVNVICEKGYKA